ncbi:MAG: heavy metal translocating P-type ATPase [Gammaproteobacteria bacterium]|nr:heavy metal translocating P-type ATPase [Gammaproteobacteria bacterium]
MEHDKHEGHEGHQAEESHQGNQEPAEHGSYHDEHQKHADKDQHQGHQDHAAGHEEDHGEHVDHTGHEEMFRKRFWISTLISIPVLIFSSAIQEFLGYSIAEFPGSAWITPVFAVIVFFYGGVPFLQMAGPEIKKRQPGMMTLISLAIGVAFIYSLAAQLFSLGTTFFWELVTLIDVMLLGHWLEMRSVRQASGALDELAKLMPDTAERILEDGETEEVQVSELQNGDRILVRPGASVPADGEIIKGESDLDESMITGESKPVSKSQGDQVIGGTINGDGSLRVKITATGDDTALAGIMRLVEEAQSSKSDTQILADKAAGWLFYIAVGVAALTAVGWVIAIGFDVQIIARVATVLVIACPHALGLAVPLVVAITTAMGANNGILVRDRLSLEKAREIDTVIFDKTGTLTKGEFGVVQIAASEGNNDNDVLALAAAIEGDSEHTIARGIRNKAEELELSLPGVSNFEAIKGRGVQATSQDSKVYIGGPRMLEMLELTLPEKLNEFEQSASNKGQSVVHVIRDQQVLGSLALADVIREESRQAVDKLHEMGIEVVMLTGDSQAVAQSVAEELEIDQFFAEVLPEDKDKKVISLQKEGKQVAMVGDGVNDAPALTRADVGIAIGSGTDVAVESAGMILVKSNPLDVVKIFALSRASYRKMIQNLVWATGYNVIALPLAAGVLAPFGILLSPAVGAVFMSLSTVIVAINAQLLRRQELTTA